MSASEATTSEVAAASDPASDPVSGCDERPVSEAGRRLLEVLARVQRNSDLTEDEAMSLVNEERAAWRAERREEQRAATRRTAR